MPMRLFVAAVLGSGLAHAQQAGTVVEEGKPPMKLEVCTGAEGCEAETAALTIDANWRWVHNADGYTNCFTDGVWNQQFCPDGAACAKNCAVEGIDLAGYETTYGVKPTEEGVELQFVSPGGNVGSRVYLTDGNESYKLFKLKNREFTIDVDVATLPCGMNGALYLIEMDELGGKGLGDNEAGAKFGTGYCDAQCPRNVKWTDGEANDGQYGMCCFEMDIWEANRRTTAYTPHACSVEGAYRCQGTECGDGEAGERYLGVCDKDGCDYNAYRMGDLNYYGIGENFVVDTTKRLTVVTQFITSNGTDQGDLVEMRRVYVQEGQVLGHASSTVPGTHGDTVDDALCTAQKNFFGDPDDFKNKGGMKAMGESLDRGMVLALSIWDDGATHMSWLDSRFPQDAPADRAGAQRGPCDGSTSSPEYLRTHHAGASVKYENIRYGEIGSTTPGVHRRLDDVLV